MTAPTRLGCTGDPADNRVFTVMRLSIHLNSDTEISAESYQPRIGPAGVLMTFTDPRGGGVLDLYIPRDELVRMFKAATKVTDAQAKGAHD